MVGDVPRLMELSFGLSSVANKCQPLRRHSGGTRTYENRQRLSEKGDSTRFADPEGSVENRVRGAASARRCPHQATAAAAAPRTWSCDLGDAENLGIVVIEIVAQRKNGFAAVQVVALRDHLPLLVLALAPHGNHVARQRL